MVILDLLEEKKSKAIDPCMNELTSGGMKIIEAAELILSRVSTKQLTDINDKLMKEIGGLDEDRDKINNMYTGKGV